MEADVIRETYQIAVMVRAEADYVRGILGSEFMGCRFDYFNVESIDHLRDYIMNLSPVYDGILTSGTFSDRLVELTKGDIPHRYFAPSMETYYRKILMSVMKNPNLKTEEIRLDLMMREHDLPSIIYGNRLSLLMSEEYEMIRKMSDSQVAAYEKEMVSRTERAAKSGEYKLFLTRSTITLEMLKNYPAEVEYVNLEKEDIYREVAALRREIELRKLRDSQIAAIVLRFAEGEGDTQWQKTKQIIDKYTRSRMLPDLLFAPVADGYLAYTDVRNVNVITRDRSFCELSSHLYVEGIRATLGYGIGATGEAAKSHAILANTYASAHAMEHGRTFLMENSGHIVGLIISQDNSGEEYYRNREAAFSIPARRINEMAKNAHLSSSTLYKLLSAMNQSRKTTIDSPWLVSELGFSQRMANKILLYLQRAGYAEVVGRSQWSRQGRPTLEYRIRMEE